jgi:hypothetical protein
MKGVFISYRRESTAAHAGRLADDLRLRLPKAIQVFHDIDSIEYGSDFIATIEARLDACAVGIVLIGRGWADTKDAKGNRRLDNPDDVMRLEIRRALERGLNVVPVLVDNAQVPEDDALPGDIRALTRRQATEISEKRWQADVADLATHILHIIDPRAALPWWRRNAVAIVAACVAAIVAAGVLVNRKQSPGHRDVAERAAPAPASIRPAAASGIRCQEPPLPRGNVGTEVFAPVLARLKSHVPDVEMAPTGSVVKQFDVLEAVRKGTLACGFITEEVAANHASDVAVTRLKWEKYVLIFNRAAYDALAPAARRALAG